MASSISSEAKAADSENSSFAMEAIVEAKDEEGDIVWSYPSWFFRSRSTDYTYELSFVGS